MEELTLRAKLVAKCVDVGGYITYVFENLEPNTYEEKYLMCIQFPNWNQTDINLFDIGYVNVRFVKEGVSQWQDGEKLNVYKYTNVVFLKFIKEPEPVNKEFLVD